MNDMSPPPTGHNLGPALNPEVLEQFRARAAEFAETAAQWKEAGKFTSETEAEKANDFLHGVRAFYKEVEARRVSEKAPYLDAGREIDKGFNSLKEMIERIANQVKAPLESYMQERDAKIREENARRAREETARAKAAEDARNQARYRNDIISEQQAEAEQREALQAAEEAEKPGKFRLGSATGGGKPASLRTKRHAIIKNRNQAMLHYRDHPAMDELLTRLANADIRAAKGAEIHIPGFDIKEERKL